MECAYCYTIYPLKFVCGFVWCWNVSMIWLSIANYWIMKLITSRKCDQIHDSPLEVVDDLWISRSKSCDMMIDEWPPDLYVRRIWLFILNIKLIVPQNSILMNWNNCCVVHRCVHDVFLFFRKIPVQRDKDKIYFSEIHCVSTDNQFFLRLTSP